MLERFNKDGVYMNNSEKGHSKEELQNAAFLLAVLAHTDKNFENLGTYFPMTQELWERCLWVCTQEGNIEQYNELWNKYPVFAENFMQQLNQFLPGADS